MAKISWRAALSATLASSVLLAGCGAGGIMSGDRADGGFDALGKRQGAGHRTNGFTPAWVKDAIFYQIFPERFANGEKGNDPAKTEAWGGKPENANYFGGDLAGVEQKLPYLKSLGVNAIYFNPIFEADSNHKYNTTNYMKIDPHFGTLAQFKSVLAGAHRNGMRVILDGVFNHTGDAHVFFQDCVKNGPKSPYWNFYSIWGFPVVNSPKPNYNAWWGFGSLPQLRVKDNPDVQKHLFDVAEYWTRQGIDGWRLDVPNEIDSDDFWRTWRKKVRAINPDAYIVGEIWEDGSHWLQGDQFDAVMNYLYRGAILDFFAYQKISVDDLDARLASLRQKYGPEVTQSMFNILSSHDVPRLLTESGGNVKRAREALFFSMVYPGAPVVYYGDEIGMAGGKDPDNRHTMNWETVRGNDMLAFTQKLIAVRKAHPALRGGEFRTLMRHNHFRQFAFIRASEQEKMVVAMNSGAEPRDFAVQVGGDFPDGTVLTDAITGARFTVKGGTLAIPAMPSQTGVILGAAGRP